MRKSIPLLILCPLLFALCAVTASAEPAYVEYLIKLGATSTTATAQRNMALTNNPRGYIDEILVQAPSKGSVTAAVSVVTWPNVGTNMAHTILFTNAALTSAAKSRPRVEQTDNTGTTYSSNTVPTERLLCNGDPVVLRVKQVSDYTNVEFKAWIKIDK